jgi:hypothetical protein
MMSITHRFLIDAVKLGVAHDEKVGRILPCVEETGAGHRRSLA